jgi:hypothetical protein
MSITMNKPSLGDRYAEITVVAVTVIALLIGWFYKSGVESRSVAFESGGVSAALPSAWIKSESQGNDLVTVTDQSSSGFPTTYSLRKSKVSNDVTYSLFASAETRSLSQDLIAFRVLSQQKVIVNGVNGFEIKYVFVESDPNAARQTLPAIVLGLEYIFLKDGQAVVVNYRADQAEYEAGLGLFHRFLSSVKY